MFVLLCTSIFLSLFESNNHGKHLTSTKLKIQNQELPLTLATESVITQFWEGIEESLIYHINEIKHVGSTFRDLPISYKHAGYLWCLTFPWVLYIAKYLDICFYQSKLSIFCTNLLFYSLALFYHTESDRNALSFARLLKKYVFIYIKHTLTGECIDFDT